ncbi:winged helix-turn-helix domain-containing protein [Burkholderia ubonensis]|uniref:winged helix-turn-helix domain-containing protein n=1 Tax=Burkholderia ubonensis TaxID=101571 RepID=UPI0039F5BA67
MINSRCVKLTGKEFEIAWLLFSHKNEEVNRRQISMAVWGTSEDVVGRSIEQYVYRLRSKLNLDGEFGVRLETLYARGYKVSEVNCNR